MDDHDIQQIRADFDSQISTVTNTSHLQELRVAFLGRKGHVNNLFARMRSLPAEKIGEWGVATNTLKNDVEHKLNELESKLQSQKQEQLQQSLDTGIPGQRPKIGNLHPTTRVIREINSFFRYLGYSVYEGPEIETDENCFAKLNVPSDHPARDLQDTLYIAEPEWLLRTQTSSVEARALTQEQPPLRIVVPGKVYRNETSSATNNSIFYQYQGLCVDKDISLAELRGTLSAFLRFLYGEDVKIRIRCKYYPEVEPGAGMDIQCQFCSGNGCHVCKYRGWVEILGSGMVHPNTLRACNIDPHTWSGFAFGLGLDRLVMQKYGISDIRTLYNGSLVYEDSI